jgi:hypothetical protein
VIVISSTGAARQEPRPPNPEHYRSAPVREAPRQAQFLAPAVKRSPISAAIAVIFGGFVYLKRLDSEIFPDPCMMKGY